MRRTRVFFDSRLVKACAPTLTPALSPPGTRFCNSWRVELACSILHCIPAQSEHNRWGIKANQQKVLRAGMQEDATMKMLSGRAMASAVDGIARCTHAMLENELAKAFHLVTAQEVDRVP